MTRAAILAGAYLLGGIPFGYLLFRLARGKDIRDHGSGNIGATNIARMAGWGPGVLTLILDAGKGALAAWLGARLLPDPGWASAAGFAAVAGHCYPVYLGFRGGKGVATGAGAFLILNPAAMGVAAAVFLAGAGLTRRVAVGSVLSAAGFALTVLVMGGLEPPALWAAGAAMLILIRHQENIRRILRGEEKQLWGENKAEAE